jgi:hypothetical protein
LVSRDESDEKPIPPPKSSRSGRAEKSAVLAAPKN